MEKIERKFTEKECEEIGGHFWKYWDKSMDVDKITFNPTGIINCVYYPNGAPKFRGCPVCGRIEILVPAQWEEYSKGKNDEK